MAKNLVDGTNIVIEENENNINMNLSSTYTNALNQTINNSFRNNNVYSTTETIIGICDDKLLYRIEYDVTSDLSSGITSGNQYTLDSISTTFVSNINRLKNVEISRTGNNQVIYNGYNFFQKIDSTNKLQFSAGFSLALTSPQKFKVTLEYTKNTD